MTGLVSANLSAVIGPGGEATSVNFVIFAILSDVGLNASSENFTVIIDPVEYIDYFTPPGNGTAASGSSPYGPGYIEACQLYFTPQNTTSTAPRGSLAQFNASFYSNNSKTNISVYIDFREYNDPRALTTAKLRSEWLLPHARTIELRPQERRNVTFVYNTSAAGLRDGSLYTGLFVVTCENSKQFLTVGLATQQAFSEDIRTPSNFLAFVALAALFVLLYYILHRRATTR